MTFHNLADKKPLIKALGEKVSESSFNFPVSLSEKYRPMKFEDFIGLEKPRRIMAKFSEAPKSCAFLFVGPSGTGKTCMAQAVCTAIRGEFHHLPSGKCDARAIDEIVRQCWYVANGGTFHVVVVDEADRMTEGAQLALLSKLDSTAAPPQTIWVFTCNDTKGLEPRFLSRCMVVEFSSYGMAGEIATFLDRVWHAEGGNGNCPDLTRLAKETRNNVRDCLNRLEVDLLGA